MPGDEERWLGVWERVTESVSRWAIGVVIIATIAGTTQGVTAWLLGSSYAVALGVIAGLLDMIPNIGATIAGFVLVPTLWAEEGLTAAIIMLIVVLVYQQLENSILTPKIQGKAVSLSPFFIIVAVTLFGALLGVLGALTAVPLAATIQILIQELTKARREKVAEAKAALEPPPVGAGLVRAGYCGPVSRRPELASASDSSSALRGASAVRGDVEHDAEPDQDPLGAADVRHRAPGEDVHERRPGQDEQPEERPDPRIERELDTVTEDPDEDERDPWAETEGEQGGAAHGARFSMAAGGESIAAPNQVHPGEICLSCTGTPGRL